MTDLQTLLAAAERLENPEYDSARQDRQLLEFAMADLLRPLLPGRPVPIDWSANDAPYSDEMVWFVENDILCFDRAEDAIWRLEDCYRTLAEADREAYWRRLEAVIRQAGEMAQGDGNGQ